MDGQSSTRPAHNRTVVCTGISTGLVCRGAGGGGGGGGAPLVCLLFSLWGGGGGPLALSAFWWPFVCSFYCTQNGILAGRPVLLDWGSVRSVHKPSLFSYCSVFSAGDQCDLYTSRVFSHTIPS